MSTHWAREHRARAISEGIVEGLVQARATLSREAQEEFMAGNLDAALALRRMYDKLHIQIRDYQVALEGDEMEHPSGI